MGKLLIRSFLIAVVLVVIGACAVKPGKFFAGDEIKLNRNTNISSMGEYRGNYLVFSWNDACLALFDKQGSLISEYIKHGKGPGEMEPGVVEYMGRSGNVVYLAHTTQNKVMMIKIDDKTKVFSFLDEFRIEEGRLSGGVPLDDCTLMVYTGDFCIYDINGSMKNRFEANLKGSNELEKRIDAMRWIYPAEGGFYTVSHMNYNIRFYSVADNTIIETADFRPVTIHVSDNYKIVRNDSGVSLQGGPGIYGATVLGDKIAIMVRPKDDNDIPSVQIYDKNGEHHGTCLLDSGSTDRKALFIAGSAGKKLIIVEQDLKTKMELGNMPVFYEADAMCGKTLLQDVVYSKPQI